MIIDVVMKVVTYQTEANCRPVWFEYICCAVRGFVCQCHSQLNKHVHSTYEGVSTSFRTGRLGQELQMIQLLCH
jgi:hypothetical protein